MAVKPSVQKRNLGCFTQRTVLQGCCQDDLLDIVVRVYLLSGEYEALNIFGSLIPHKTLVSHSEDNTLDTTKGQYYFALF